MARKHNGYTLIELLVVVLIIVIILSVSVPNFIRLSQRAEVDKVAKELAAMFNDMLERTESEMAFYKYFILINNHAKEIDGKKVLQIKLLRYNNSGNFDTLREFQSKIVKINGGSLIADQKLTCFCVDNKIQLYDFSVNYEYEIPSYLGGPNYSPKNYNEVTLTVYSINNQNIKKDIVIKDFPAGSVQIR